SPTIRTNIPYVRRQFSLGVGSDAKVRCLVPACLQAAMKGKRSMPWRFWPTWRLQKTFGHFQFWKANFSRFRTHPLFVVAFSVAVIANILSFYRYDRD